VLVILAGLAVPMAAIAQPGGGAGASGGSGGAGSAGGTTTMARASADKLSADVPIKRITLYRSGVGYFERSGTVDGSADVQLRFTTEQVNDILKSMVLLDLDGGKIESVSYGSKEPLSKRLASFGINISGNPSVPDLLNQLRGAPIKVATSGSEVSGTILGVEQRPSVPAANAPSVNVPYVNLVTGAGVKSVAISEIVTFDILDKELAGELNKALSALAEYRADRTKTVDMRFSGAGSRRVVVGYVHEMPVWKTSYRLVLPDDDGAGGKAPPRDGKDGQLVMQGWAIVENTTDQDWSNVGLSLVSGRPVSFQMDLYEPLFTTRPWVSVPTIPGVNPRAFAGGMDESKKVEAMAMERRERSVGRSAPDAMPVAPAPTMAMAGSSARLAAVAESAVTAEELANYSPAARAQAAEVGEVFQYQLDTPISIERQRSAMLPILSTNIPGRRVSIFNASDNSEHPMRGVEITNESNLQILPGPISVFDGAAYAGDAQINHVSKGEKRLLAYSMDLDVGVQTSNDSASNLVKVRIVDGLFEQTTKSRMSTTYTFDNKDAKRGRVVILEHPKQYGGWELVDTTSPSETTSSLLRFNLELGAGKKAAFKVTHEQTSAQSIGVTNIDMPNVVSFHKAGKLSDRVLAAMREVAKKQAEINDLGRSIDQANEKRAEIERERGSISGSIVTIDRTSDLYRSYISKLTEQMKEADGLKDRRDRDQAKMNQLQTEFNEYVRSLNVE
jgi:hypothetical protein